MTSSPDVPGTTLAEDYSAWLERVRATFEAVQYICVHRLVDRRLAEPVAVQVAAGLLSRPGVFRYFGLPFSGRIARLAEARIAEADAGELAPVCGWEELRERLERLPAEHRDVLVVTCVHGEDVEALAAGLGCDEVTAQRRHEAMLAYMHELAGPGLARAPDPDTRS